MELHLDIGVALCFCCLLRRVSQPLLNEHSQMRISGSPARPDCHQLFLNAAVLSVAAPGGSASAAPGLEQTGQFVWEDLTAQE